MVATTLSGAAATPVAGRPRVAGNYCALAEYLARRYRAVFHYPETCLIYALDRGSR